MQTQFSYLTSKQIRSPFQKSAYCPHAQFYPRHGRKTGNSYATGKETSRRHHHLIVSVYAIRCRCAHRLRLRVGRIGEEQTGNAMPGAVSSTRNYFQHEVRNCRGHVGLRSYGMRPPLSISFEPSSLSMLVASAAIGANVYQSRKFLASARGHSVSGRASPLQCYEIGWSISAGPEHQDSSPHPEVIRELVGACFPS